MSELQVVLVVVAVVVVVVVVVGGVMLVVLVVARVGKGTSPKATQKMLIMTCLGWHNSHHGHHVGAI